MKHMPNYIIPLAISALGAVQTAADACVFVKYDGIDGEALAEGYEGYIDVTAWSWELSQSADPTNPIVRPIQMSKTADSTTPKLHEFLINGVKAPQVTMKFVTTGVNELKDYMVIDMTNVTVSSYSTSGPADNVPTESFSLNFDSYCVTFIKYDATGARLPGEPACWKLK